MAKHGFLFGLLVGGAAAYAAYRSLDADKREEIAGVARDRYNDLKDRAVDYAFYASDALDDFKGVLQDRAAQATDTAWPDVEASQSDVTGDTQLKTASDHLRSELASASEPSNDDGDDIVLNGEDTMGGAPIKTQEDDPDTDNQNL